MPEARRITGPHLLLPGTGAAIELSSEDPEPVGARARGAAERLGWPAHVAVRRHASGSTVAMSAPPDVLYTACAVLEWAVEPGEDRWRAVRRELAGEENVRLRELLKVSHSPVFSDDDFGFTVGLGRHSRTWQLDDLPDEVPANDRIPFVFLTGTNGKTTTTRMLARIAIAAGFRPGWTSSDAYGVGTEVIERGDWTGPGAARRVLRHPEVDYACLETARGGLLRRGLVIGGADAAVVTNVSSDHLGEWGVHDLADMAEAKLGVVAGVGLGGVLVVNAGNRWLREAVPRVREARPDLRVWWFADGEVDGIALAATAGAHDLVVGGHRIGLDAIPLTYGGTARHNVENAMAAALAARATGISHEQIARGLESMTAGASDSRGRMNRFVLPNGASVLVDFGHNPDGVSRVARSTLRWPATRRSILVGQAGDRTDDDLRALAGAVAAARPDRVVLKEMRKYLRGRPIGEVSARLREGLLAAGLPEQAIDLASDELAGVASMVDRAAPGELLLLFVQEDLDAVLDLLDQQGARPA